jgi:hypothetical protein
MGKEFGFCLELAFLTVSFPELTLFIFIVDACLADKYQDKTGIPKATTRWKRVKTLR